MTLCDRLAAYFKERPGQWIDGMELSGVAGCYAWRSRTSDLRRPKHLGGKYEMQIENRQRTVRGHALDCSAVLDGDDCDCLRRTYTISEYRYVPASLLEVAS